MHTFTENPAAPIAVPRAFLNEGELYAGILLGKNGDPDQHIILLPDEKKGIWTALMKWAKSLGASLPTRREQSLLFANLKEEFKPTWYWSCEQCSTDSTYAWMQHFINGNQGSTRRINSYAGRVVRRLVIQPLSHSDGVDAGAAVAKEVGAA